MEDIEYRHGTPEEDANDMRPLRIVLVSYRCDPHRGTEPGLGWAWAEALARRGHTVDILTRRDGDNVRTIARRIADLGSLGDRVRPHLVALPAFPWWTSVVPGPLREQALEFASYDGWQKEALRYAREHGLSTADLVHHVSYGSLVGGSALRQLGPPLVFGPVGGGQTAPFSHKRFVGSGFGRELVRDLLWVRALSHRHSCRATVREAAAVLTTNTDTARRARRLGCRNPVMRLADGVPDDLLRTAGSRQARRTSGAPTVLWVGRLAPFKAPKLALHAFSRLKDRVPNARLVVLGDGPLRAATEDLASRLGVSESVVFRGRVPWDQALQAYDEADVLLFTSLRDSSGVQTLEAWAQGLPVVHLDHQGVGDFSAPGGAVAVPLGDPADLPDRMALALHEVLADDEAWTRMSEAALRWARGHTWAAKAESAEGLYRELLGRPRSPAPAPAVAAKTVPSTGRSAALPGPPCTPTQSRRTPLAGDTRLSRPVVLHVSNEPVLQPRARFMHAFAGLANERLLVHVPVAPRALLTERGREQALRTIRDLARQARPDLVFVQSPHAFPWEPGDVAGLLDGLGRPLVIHWEGDAWGGRKLVGVSTASWLRYADQVFSVAVGPQAALLGRHSRTPVRYVPHVVPGYLVAKDDRGVPGIDAGTVDVAHIGNRCVRFGCWERLDGALDRQRLVRGLTSQREDRIALYGHGWRGRSARGAIPFERQLECMRDAKITCGWDHYQSYTGYFSDRLPIALYAGRPHVSSRPPGIEWLPGPETGLHLCDTPAQAVCTVRSLLRQDLEALHTAGMRAHRWSRARMTDRQALLHMLGDVVRLPPPPDDPWLAIAQVYPGMDPARAHRA